MPPNTAGGALALAGNTSLSLQVSSVDDLTRLARVFAASGLFNRNGSPDAQLAQCAVQLMAGMEAGFTPFASITGVYVVNGRPGFSAQLLAQAIKRHPDYDYRVLEKTDQVCRIQFRCRGEVLGVETFSMDMANRAGLTVEKPDRRGISPWKAYPEAMLFARCLTAGMRTHCPDALGGHTAYTPEELGAEGQIDEDGMVTVTVTEQQPSRDVLQAQALRKLKDAGLTAVGMQAMLDELGGPDARGLGQLPDETLRRLASAGASAETVNRWNTPPAVEPDPEPEPIEPELDDADDLPAAWAA